MNRDKKFRVYLKNFDGYNKHHFNRPEIGKLYDVQGINFEAEYVTFRCPSEVEFTFDQVELMQYTGLKDKNNKEIYEGDIIKLNEPFCNNLDDIREIIAEVIYSESSYFLVSKRVGWVASVGSYHKKEIIGNIFENPELLTDNMTREPKQ